MLNILLTWFTFPVWQRHTDKHMRVPRYVIYPTPGLRSTACIVKQDVHWHKNINTGSHKCTITVHKGDRQEGKIRRKETYTEEKHLSKCGWCVGPDECSCLARCQHWWTVKNIWDTQRHTCVHIPAKILTTYHIHTQTHMLPNHSVMISENLHHWGSPDFHNSVLIKERFSLCNGNCWSCCTSTISSFTNSLWSTFTFKKALWNTFNINTDSYHLKVACSQWELTPNSAALCGLL